MDGAPNPVTQRVVAGPTGPTQPDPVLVDELASYRRRLLWRDTATVLIAVIIAILAAQTFLPSANGGPVESATPYPTGVTVGSLPPPVTLPPLATFGGIIDPSLGIDATPTPIPVITLGPPTPTPKPSVKPTATPRVTPKPTPKASAVPAVAGFSWSPSTPAPGQLVQFTSSSTGATSWTWDFGDSEGSSAQNPTHTYLVPNTYVVTLTVSGPGGTDSVTHNVTVAVAP